MGITLTHYCPRIAALVPAPEARPAASETGENYANTHVTPHIFVADRIVGHFRFRLAGRKSGLIFNFMYLPPSLVGTANLAKCAIGTPTTTCVNPNLCLSWINQDLRGKSTISEAAGPSSFFLLNTFA